MKLTGYFLVNTPMGGIKAVLDQGVYQQVSWQVDEPLKTAPIELQTYFNQYFLHQKPLGKVAINLSNMSAFSRDVLSHVKIIAFGQVISYQAVAKAIGQPHAFRAVGQALKRNPFVLIIPCHRVVPKSFPSNVGGYLGKQVDKKSDLLKLEGHHHKSFN